MPGHEVTLRVSGWLVRLVELVFLVYSGMFLFRATQAMQRGEHLTDLVAEMGLVHLGMGLMFLTGALRDLVFAEEIARERREWLLRHSWVRRLRILSSPTPQVVRSAARGHLLLGSLWLCLGLLWTLTI